MQDRFYSNDFGINHIKFSDTEKNTKHTGDMFKKSPTQLLGDMAKNIPLNRAMAVTIKQLNSLQDEVGFLSKMKGGKIDIIEWIDFRCGSFEAEDIKLILVLFKTGFSDLSVEFIECWLCPGIPASSVLLNMLSEQNKFVLELWDEANTRKRVFEIDNKHQLFFLQNKVMTAVSLKNIDKEDFMVARNKIMKGKDAFDIWKELG